MSLQEKLDAFKAQFKKQAPAEALEIFERSMAELIESGQAKKALKVGDQAPSFSLKDSDGNDVKLDELLVGGPVIITFYRGVWCPYCNLELQALEEVADDLKSRGATLVAISMQRAADSKKSQRDNKLSFPILTDKAGEVSKKFGVRWTLPSYLVKAFQTFKIDLPFIHDDIEWNLPMPGRFVIDSEGTIAYAEVNPDYTHRPEPADLFPVLDAIAKNA